MINIIEKTIHSDYRLLWKKGQWFLQGNSGAIGLRVSGMQSFGFSLDRASPKALAFLSAQPPRHVAKVCDGMIAVLYEAKLYLFAVEIKSGHKEDANKQLANGQLFWRWLMSLYERHNYFCDPQVKVRHIRLLVWQPRKNIPRRGTTVHQDQGNLQKRSKADGFDACFEAKNQEDIPLFDLIRQC